ncbi:MAG: SDR family oxidoreductase [Propionibacteriales bacterium]|nr:SDR family oxidoreductase [Propionibacteriales bacterium]
MEMEMDRQPPTDSADTHGDPMFSVAGRKVVVTGASSGIGRHLATALAERGARVLAMDAHEQRLLGWTPEVTGTQAAVCDVRDEVAVSTALGDFAREHGPLDFVITCAALAEQLDSEEITAQRFRDTLDVNVVGTFLVARAAARLMRETGGGSIALVGSQLGRVTKPKRSAYSTSKAAVEMLAKVMALDFAEWGVRVNCLSPGPVLTDRIRDALLGEEADAQARMLIGRYLVPADLLGAVLFLASPASGSMTGANLLVDGGYSVI